jgi:plasmid stabilization system protein ParE
MRVRFTPAAEAHFFSALDFIRRDDPSAAVRFRDKARESLERLKDFPESGRRIPEFPDLPHREIIVKPYRFFYRIREDAVWIVGVWHDAQLPDQPSA